MIKPYDVEVRSALNILKAEKFIMKHGGIVTDKFSCKSAGIYLLRAHMNKDVVELCKHEKFIKLVEPMSRLTGV